MWSNIREARAIIKDWLAKPVVLAEPLGIYFPPKDKDGAKNGPLFNIPSWDQYFLRLADDVALRSKDPNTKRGAVIVGPHREIRSTGYNSFPRGIRDDKPERYERPTKYRWIEHSERNAIYNAARCGIVTEGCILYQQVMPCMSCARAIVNAGIVEVVMNQDLCEAYTGSKWESEFAEVLVLFEEAGIKLRQAKI